MRLRGRVWNYLSASYYGSQHNGKTKFIETLYQREQLREIYWHKRAPIVKDRLLWRAQTCRHLTHLLPGQTILELGCGSGLFTKQLYRVTRGENPITAATFLEHVPNLNEFLPVEYVCLSSFPGQFANRRYDCIIVMDLHDKRNGPWLLECVYALLNPGGQVIFMRATPETLSCMPERYSTDSLGRMMHENSLIAQSLTVLLKIQDLSIILRFTMILYMRRLHQKGCGCSGTCPSCSRTCLL